MVYVLFSLPRGVLGRIADNKIIRLDELMAWHFAAEAA